ncbi:UvrB/UvrC motif-containing protein [Kyrpidia tusciae]|uniref:UvrB/UvrC protein n=1 Tax=Kyrpidia tusciae (strain DSM 2912 / NBRC 15312 / T2) TaxID=562970 RepID=D5WRN7_KYRT2|nr:UvrB/UvrC motif-containing protein [Kyrpidia tusciae]ADG04898.1 UvrB/UvrC protein [Kyrpidia tusciae DSM 2912]
MICQQCGKRPATVHMTKIVNGQKSERHLCEICANESGELKFVPGAFSFPNLLGSFFSGEAAPGVPQVQTLRCPTCGLTYQQFTQVSRFGCPNCYQAFDPVLDPMLRRIHGSTTHTGKVPRRGGGKLRVRRELEHLKEQLQEKVRLEQFEEAARLRDQIRALEQQLGG